MSEYIDQEEQLRFYQWVIGINTGTWLQNNLAVADQIYKTVLLVCFFHQTIPESNFFWNLEDYLRF